MKNEYLDIVNRLPARLYQLHGSYYIIGPGYCEKSRVQEHLDIAVILKYFHSAIECGDKDETLNNLEILIAYGTINMVDEYSYDRKACGKLANLTNEEELDLAEQIKLYLYWLDKLGDKYKRIAETQI